MVSAQSAPWAELDHPGALLWGRSTPAGRHGWPVCRRSASELGPGNTLASPLSLRYTTPSTSSPRPLGSPRCSLVGEA